MTGYDRKTLELSHDNDAPVTFTIEIDFDHTGWRTYQELTVPLGKTIRHAFADGFSAHWARLTADKDREAAAWFRYK